MVQTFEEWDSRVCVCSLFSEIRVFVHFTHIFKTHKPLQEETTKTTQHFTYILLYFGLKFEWIPQVSISMCEFPLVWTLHFEFTMKWKEIIISVAFEEHDICYCCVLYCFCYKSFFNVSSSKLHFWSPRTRSLYVLWYNGNRIIWMMVQVKDE